MDEFTEWRGFDLTARRAKIVRAFNLEEVTSPEDVPLIVNTPCYFAFGGKQVPEDYFTNPACMVEYQARGFERHLAAVDDDVMPYYMPWFGTGVLASAFGCEISDPVPGDDPAVVGPCIHSLADVARLKMPDPDKDGWMPRVLEAIDYAVSDSDLPPGLTDMQGPLDTLGLMCGQAQLYQWMYKEPRMVHELFDLVTHAFIDWVKAQKKHIGEPLDRSNGLQGVWSPTGVGIWESDDDLVLLGPDLYGEFVVPYVSRIFKAFGGGSVHFCGKGSQHIENLLQIDSLRVVNTSPMADFESFSAVRRALAGKATIQIQDVAPVDIEAYYARLYDSIDDFRGLMLATFVVDTIAMQEDGGYVPVDWEPFEAANRIVAVTRECVRKKLAGEPILAESAREVIPVAKPFPEQESPSELPAAQEAALREVRERLISMDGEGIKAAVRDALGTGLAPFDIVTMGMAEGMAEVGRRYEEGDFFLPELVMAGGTMKEGMTVLGPLLKSDEGGKVRSKGTVLFGTVEGDLHDIGKNIVETLLEAAGYEVHDLGVGQSAASFVAKVRETDADVVAMSALLTTTMKNMAGVIEALEQAGLRERVRVMVGGAPITRDFANLIGAEGYAPDAVKAVREADRLMAELRSGQGG